MWFDIWLIVRGIVLHDIFQPPTPFPTRVLLVFWTSVTLFSQVVCLLVYFYVSIFLKEMKYFVWKLGRDLRRVLSGIQIDETVFTLVTLRRGAVLSYLLPIFVYRYFFGVTLFLENHSIASDYLFTEVLRIIQRVTLLKKSFSSSLFLLGAILRCFGAYFGLSGMLLYIWELFTI